MKPDKPKDFISLMQQSCKSNIDSKSDLLLYLHHWPQWPDTPSGIKGTGDLLETPKYTTGSSFLPYESHNSISHQLLNDGLHVKAAY